MLGFTRVLHLGLALTWVIIKSVCAQEVAGNHHPGCMVGQFECRTGTCINPELMCNGEDDCGDNSDEFPLQKQCSSAFSPIQKAGIVLGCVLGVPFTLAMSICIIVYCCPCGHKDAICEICACCGFSPKQHSRIHPIEEDQDIEESPLQEQGETSADFTARQGGLEIYVIEEDDSKLLVTEDDKLQHAVV